MAEEKRSVDPQLAQTVADVQEAQRDAAEKPSNAVSEETGQFDTRFMLWRSFCARYGVPVDALPSELSGEAKEAWEKLKDNALHKPAEGK